MSRFSIGNPYFIVVVCLVLSIIGAVTVVRRVVDLFPEINLPEVVVATFYSGMPPEDIETDITNPLERFFTLAAGIVSPMDIVDALNNSSLIRLAIPMGFVGIFLILPLTGTTLNVMSLMGILMLFGIADSNSILIVDFAHRFAEQGLVAAGLSRVQLPTQAT